MARYTSKCSVLRSVEHYPQFVRPPHVVFAQVSLAVYTSIVCKQLFDVVSKQVHFFLVDNICDGFMAWML